MGEYLNSDIATKPPGSALIPNNEYIKKKHQYFMIPSRIMMKVRIPEDQKAKIFKDSTSIDVETFAEKKHEAKVVPNDDSVNFIEEKIKTAIYKQSYEEVLHETITAAKSCHLQEIHTKTFNKKREIKCIAISYDEKYIVGGSIDTSVKIWTLKSPINKIKFYGHCKDVNSVIFSDNDRYIISGSSDGTVKIWNIKEQREEFYLTHGKNSVIAVAQKGLLLASGTEEGDCYVWDINKKELSNKLNYTGKLNSIAISANMRCVAFGGDYLVYIFPKERRTCTDLSIRDILCISITNNAKFIIMGTSGNKVVIMDLKTSKISDLVGHTGFVRALAISSDNKYIVSGSDDKQIIVWNLIEKREEFVLKSHSNFINSVAISKKYIVSCSKDFTIKIWSLEEKKYDFSLKLDSVANCTVISNDGNLIASGSNNNKISLWDVHEKNKIFSFEGHTDSVSSVVFSKDGKYLLSGGSDCKIIVWDIEAKNIESTYDIKSSINCLAVSNNGQYIVCGTFNRSVVVLDLFLKTEYFRVEGHYHSVMSVAISNCAKYVVSGSRDKTLKLWNLESKLEEFTFESHTGFVNSVVFSPDGKYIVSGSEDKTIKIWNFQNKREEWTFYGHENGILSLKMTNDNKYILSGSFDRYAKIWNFLEKREEFQIYCENYVNSVSISDDGKCIVCATEVDAKVLSFFYSYSDSSIKNITPIYNAPFLFYNAIRCIKNDNFNDISPDSHSMVISEYMFTLTHILCYLGKIEAIEMFTNCPGFSLKCDCFGKSPIYYSIAKKNQNITDFLIKYLGDISIADNTQFNLSLHSIRNDFHLLLRNSSRNLPGLLKNMLLSSSFEYAKVSNSLPIFRIRSYLQPIVSDFTNISRLSENIKEVPITLKKTPFKILSSVCSSANIDLLKAILSCSNYQIFTTHIIQYMIQMQWNSLRIWIIAYAMITLFDLVFLLIMIKTNFFVFIVVLYIANNILLFSWEVAQIVTSKKDYIKDVWNFIDLSRFLLSIIWIIVELVGFNIIYLRWFILLLSFARGIKMFIVFDGTRYYIKLIFRAINDIKFFIIVFFYSTLFFGVLFTSSRMEKMTWGNIWIQPWQVNFGYFTESDSNANSSLDFIVYMAATLLNVVLMLNLLISILGKSYEQFLLDKEIIDFREKTEIIYEFQKMMFWARNDNELEYVHVCIAAFDNQENENWEGRIRLMDSRLELIENYMKNKNQSSNNREDVVINKKIISKLEDDITEIKETLNMIVNVMNTDK